MNRKLLLFFFFTGMALTANAQPDTSLIYLRFPTVPPFSIIKIPDSTRFTKADLIHMQATLVIVFKPDCDHCQLTTKEIIKNISSFKNVQIIMASPAGYAQLKKFYEDYDLARYPGIVIGRDPGYFLGSFYKIRSFPAIFLYDTDANFVKAFDGSIPVIKIVEVLN